MEMGVPQTKPLSRRSSAGGEGSQPGCGPAPKSFPGSPIPRFLRNGGLLAGLLLLGAALQAHGTATLPELRARVVARETKDLLAEWGDGCSLYCAVGPSVRASSRLSEKGHSYPAAQAQDFDLDTAWVEGKPGHGVGEYLEYTYDLTREPVQANLAVTQMHVFNGYRKSRHLWEANSRVRRFRLLVDGRPRAYVDLADTPTMQNVDLKPIPLPRKGKVSLRFEIVSVYPGAQYQDTAITDLTFDGTGHH